MIRTQKGIITLHISKIFLIRDSESKAIITIMVIIVFRRHIINIINFILNSRWTENIIFIIVSIMYRKQSIIKVNFLFKSWGTKNIMFIKRVIPKLRAFHVISNIDIKKHTNNITTIMIVMQIIKFQRFFNFLFKNIMSKFKVELIKLSHIFVVFH